MTDTIQNLQTLQFAFTADGFVPIADARLLNDADRELQSRFEEDSFAALYAMGLRGGAETAGASAAFLALLSDTFFKRLTDLPDLELLRENARG